MNRENVLTQESDKEVEDLYKRFEGRISEEEARQVILNDKLRNVIANGKIARDQIYNNHLVKEESRKRELTFSELYTHRGNNQTFTQLVYDELYRLEYEEGFLGGPYHRLLVLCIQINDLNNKGLSKDMDVTVRMVKGLIFRVHVQN